VTSRPGAARRRARAARRFRWNRKTSPPRKCGLSGSDGALSTGAIRTGTSGGSIGLPHSPQISTALASAAYGATAARAPATRTAVVSEAMS
jgi:hypothetical protein